MSITFVPRPSNGGKDSTKAKPQINLMYRDDQKLILVCACHERSRRTTDKYLTVAIPVIVYNEFIPIKRMKNSGRI